MSIEQSAKSVLERMNSKTIVVGLSVRRPRMTYRISAGKVVAGSYDEDATDLTTGSSWKVMPKEYDKILSKLENRARKVLTRHGVPLMKGISVIPITRVSTVFAAVDDISDEYNQAARDIQFRWEEIVGSFYEKLRNSIQNGYDEIVSDLKSRIPSAEDFRKRMSMSLTYWPFGNDGTLTEKAAQELSVDIVDRLHSSARSAVESTVVRLFAEPRKEMLECIDRICRMADNGVVRESSMQSLRDCYDKISSFSFLMPEDVERNLQRAGEMMSSTITDRQAADMLKDTLKSMKKDLESVERIESIPIGEYDSGRFINLDD